MTIIGYFSVVKESQRSKILFALKNTFRYFKSTETVEKAAVSIEKTTDFPTLFTQAHSANR